MDRLHVFAVAVVFAFAAAAARSQSAPSFAGPLTYPINPIYFIASPIQVIDLDGDGRDDVVAIGGAGGDLALYRFSNPNGSLGPQYTLPSPPLFRHFTCTDLGDGTADFIATVNANNAAPSLAFGLHGARSCGLTQPLTVSTSTLQIPFSIPASSPGGVVIRGSTVIARAVAPGVPSRIESFSISAAPSITPLGASWQLPALPAGTSA